jgi:hypothetical protein
MIKKVKILNANINICKKYIESIFSVANKFMMRTTIDGMSPKIIMIEIIKETSCHRNFKFELDIPDENFTID